MLKLISKIIFAVLLCVIAALIFLGISYSHNPRKLPITTVIVQGVPDNVQNQVQTAIQADVTQGLLTVKLAKIENELQQFPWIESVEISRIWPNTLKILVQPQDVVAYWNDKNFLNKYMEVIPLFTDMPVAENLPRLYGPEQSQVKAGYYYQVLSQQLGFLNLFVIQLQLADDGDISIILNNGIKIQLGQQHILTRLQRFVKVYSKVFGAQKDLSGVEVDLRYPSGMAVNWGK